MVRDAVEHADVPFARIVEAARVPRSTAYTPVFQTMVTLQGASYGTRRVDASMSLARLDAVDMKVRARAMHSAPKQTGCICALQTSLAHTVT